MDYFVWGEEYLLQARRVYGRVEMLRLQLKTLRGDEAYAMKRRIAMLYDMYLELRCTGNLLQEYAHGDRKVNVGA